MGATGYRAKVNLRTFQSKNDILTDLKGDPEVRGNRKLHYTAAPAKNRALCGVANPVVTQTGSDVSCRQCKRLMRYIGVEKKPSMSVKSAH